MAVRQSHKFQAMYSNTNLKSSELKYLCWSKRSSVAWRCCVWRHSCFETECHLGVTWTSAVCSHKQTTALHWWPMTSAIQRLRVRDDGFRLYMRCRRLAGVQGGPTKTIPRFIFDCISWMQQWNSMIFGTYELHKKSRDARCRHVHQLHLRETNNLQWKSCGTPGASDISHNVSACSRCQVSGQTFF